MNIYSLFYDKLPQTDELLFPEKNNSKFITFLNPYYMELLYDRIDLYKDFDYICSDGMLPVLLNRLFFKAKSNRISFDMSSLAYKIFNYADNNNLSLYIIGAQSNDLNKFVNNIKNTFLHINIVGFHHGYFNDADEILNDILKKNPNIVIVGMGAPKQDEFALKLKRKHYKGTLYTCGGFIHQSSSKIDYYPKWINKLNLRTFYRLKKEPYVFKRVVKYYPKFIIKYTYFLLSKSK